MNDNDQVFQIEATPSGFDEGKKDLLPQLASLTAENNEVKQQLKEREEKLSLLEAGKNVLEEKYYNLEDQMRSNDEMLNQRQRQIVA